MRKIFALVALVAALAIPVVGGAAELHSAHIGSSCGAGEIGTWHFVNNQTGGATGGTLTVNFTNPVSVVVDNTPDKVNQNVLQWTITAAGTLSGANTGGVPGKLVLSDLTCEDAKK